MFNASVVRVLVASPSDTFESRAVLREAIEDWNALHAEANAIVALPTMWERDATPRLGAPPQEIINSELGDHCDVVIACFWTRLGSPTEHAESGTVEEIERAIKAGKPVLVYFSNQPVMPGSIDADEYKRLESFRDDLKKRGLYGEFTTPEELRRKVAADLTRVVRDQLGKTVAEPDAPQPAEANLLAAITSERELRSYSSRGQPNYSTNWTLTISNRGAAVAENLRIRFDAELGENQILPQLIGAEDPVKTLPPGGVVQYYLVVVMNAVPQFEIVMEWDEGAEHRTQSQTLRI